jgi:predicted dehydrogenase
MRVGLLGASAIGPNAVIAPAAKRGDVSIVAVAARDPTRARRYADAHGIPDIATDYAALVQRNDVDLVYCALPPAAHRGAVKLALDAGKPVLLEKPYAMDADDARVIVALADDAGLPVIEAFHYRFHPLFQRAVTLVADGAIGNVTRASASFETTVPDKVGQLQWKPTLGGGAMMDLGCYGIHALRSLLRTDPIVLSATGHFRHGVDASLTAQLQFPDVSATVHCSMLGGKDRSLTLQGSNGTLIFHNFVAAHLGGEIIIDTSAGRTVETTDSGLTTYDHQLDHVVRVFRGEEAPATGGADAIANMEMIDACRALALD